MQDASGSHSAPVAQLAAQRSPKPRVGGSSPSRCATFMTIPSWRNGKRAELRTQCRKTSRFESGGRDQPIDAGVAEKVNATLKR